MVVGIARFFVSALQTAGVEGRCVGRHVGAEQINGHAEMEIEITLNGGQVDHTQGANSCRIIRLVLRHHFAGALNHARHA